MVLQSSPGLTTTTTTTISGSRQRRPRTARAQLRLHQCRDHQCRDHQCRDPGQALLSLPRRGRGHLTGAPSKDYRSAERFKAETATQRASDGDGDGDCAELESHQHTAATHTHSLGRAQSRRSQSNCSVVARLIVCSAISVKSNAGEARRVLPLNHGVRFPRPALFVAQASSTRRRWRRQAARCGWCRYDWFDSNPSLCLCFCVLKHHYALSRCAQCELKVIMGHLYASLYVCLLITHPSVGFFIFCILLLTTVIKLRLINRATS